MHCKLVTHSRYCCGKGVYIGVIVAKGSPSKGGKKGHKWAKPMASPDEGR